MGVLEDGEVPNDDQGEMLSDGDSAILGAVLFEAAQAAVGSSSSSSNGTSDRDSNSPAPSSENKNSRKKRKRDE